METIFIVCAVGAAVYAGVAIWIRREYRKYCREAEEREDLERKRGQLTEKIQEILRNFDLFFGNGNSGTISFNVRTKAEFALSIIEKMSLEDQVAEYTRLYNMLYETWDRSDRDPNDVISIVSPLNTVCSEIARRKIGTIRKILSEETT